MSNEWKRSTWAYSPIALSHTQAHIVRAIDTALTDAGWVRASWSNGGARSDTENYYLRPDRFRLDISANLWGAAGNQIIGTSGANLSKQDIIGGGATTAGSTRGAGFVALSGQPADGNTVTLYDGTLTKVFEFDDNGSVTAPNIQVAIGTTMENSLENLAAAIMASGINLTALPHWHWWYTGDNYYQHCGIHVKIYSASSVNVSSFLEDSTKTGSQRSLVATYAISINQDNTKLNNFLFIAGEDGFYIEGGTDTNYNNIAHGFIFAFYPDASLAGTRDRERTWTCQGAAYELRGNIRSADRSWRFVETVGDRRNHTGRILAMVPRGSDSTAGLSVANDRNIYFGPRDHFLATPYNVDTSRYDTIQCTLGLFQSTYDDLYRVSTFAVMQGRSAYSTVRNSSGSETVGVPNSSGYDMIFDIRNGLRHVPKFGCCSSYLLPWGNVTDKRTSVVYRVAQVPDGGRNSNIAVVWPDNSNVTVIPATP